MDIVNKRRSIRKYSDKAVGQDEIKEMLAAAMQAPSAGNQQPWQFLVIQDRSSLKDLSRVSPYASMVADAAGAVVFLIDRSNLKFPEMSQQDLAASVENFLLKAVDLGLGAVWLGIAPLKEREVFISDLFKLPETVQPFCIVPFGHPHDEGQNRFIDRYNPEKVFFEEYN